MVINRGFGSGVPGSRFRFQVPRFRFQVKGFQVHDREDAIAWLFRTGTWETGARNLGA